MLFLVWYLHSPKAAWGSEVQLVCGIVSQNEREDRILHEVIECTTCQLVQFHQILKVNNVFLLSTTHTHTQTYTYTRKHTHKKQTQRQRLSISVSLLLSFPLLPHLCVTCRSLSSSASPVSTKLGSPKTSIF